MSTPGPRLGSAREKPPRKNLLGQKRGGNWARLTVIHPEKKRKEEKRREEKRKQNAMA
jgi:hypothetical protein